MTSIERMKEYTLLPIEGEVTDPVDPGPYWPLSGLIELKNVVLSYENYDGGPHAALKNLNIRIEHGEKVVQKHEIS